jgi:trk system potassium uptake protein TrkH
MAERLKRPPRPRRMPNPARLLVTGFLTAIGLGTVLLSLPAATVDGRGLPLVDALFEATSATCVTGLVVVDTGSTFTLFGELVILILIQVGGLGIMTVTTLFAYAVGRRISLSETLTVGEALGQPHLSGVLALARNVALLTFTAELAGAAVLTAVWSQEYPLGEALYLGVFHSVSAFCNAGFDLFGQSLAGHTTDVVVNLTFLTLIITGGLGFYVLSEVLSRRRFGPGVGNSPGGRNGRLSLHTRVVLVTSLALIAGGTLVILLFEHSNPATLGPLSPGGKVLAALFQAVTPRTAGFNTVSIAHLAPSTLLILMVFMFIGASPGSTGGGIKTTTFVALVSTIRSALRRRDDVEIGGRRLPPEVTVKSWVIASLGLGVILTATTLLLATEDAPFLTVLFETVSAFGTVGLSTGLTPELSTAGRLLVSVLMFVGRVGPFTVAVALARKRPTGRAWHLPEERIIVG